MSSEIRRYVSRPTYNGITVFRAMAELPSAKLFSGLSVGRVLDALAAPDNAAALTPVANILASDFVVRPLCFVAPEADVQQAVQGAGTVRALMAFKSTAGEPKKVLDELALSDVAQVAWAAGTLSQGSLDMLMMDVPDDKRRCFEAAQEETIGAPNMRPPLRGQVYVYLDADTLLPEFYLVAEDQRSGEVAAVPIGMDDVMAARRSSWTGVLQDVFLAGAGVVKASMESGASGGPSTSVSPACPPATIRVVNLREFSAAALAVRDGVELVVRSFLLPPTVDEVIEARSHEDMPGDVDFAAVVRMIAGSSVWSASGHGGESGGGVGVVERPGTAEELPQAGPVERPCGDLSPATLDELRLRLNGYLNELNFVHRVAGCDEWAKVRTLISRIRKGKVEHVDERTARSLGVPELAAAGRVHSGPGRALSVKSPAAKELARDLFAASVLAHAVVSCIPTVQLRPQEAADWNVRGQSAIAWIAGMLDVAYPFVSACPSADHSSAPPAAAVVAVNPSQAALRADAGAAEPVLLCVCRDCLTESDLRQRLFNFRTFAAHACRSGDYRRCECSSVLALGMYLLPVDECNEPSGEEDVGGGPGETVYEHTLSCRPLWRAARFQQALCARKAGDPLVDVNLWQEQPPVLEASIDGQPPPQGWQASGYPSRVGLQASE